MTHQSHQNVEADKARLISLLALFQSMVLFMTSDWLNCFKLPENSIHIFVFLFTSWTRKQNPRERDHPIMTWEKRKYMNIQ